MKKPNIAFENELIIVDEKWIPAYLYEWQKTSDLILKIIWEKYPKYINSWCIAPELDSCQIEIKNNWPQTCLENAQDQLMDLFDTTIETVHKLWLKIWISPVPLQDFTPIYSDKCERYKFIHEKLLSHWLDTRKATNISWLHMHIDINSLKQHALISNEIAKYFGKNEFKKLWMSQERHQMYIKVVECLIGLWFVSSWYLPMIFQSFENLEKQLLDPNGDPIFNYSYVRLKKFKSWNFTSEIRTSDWAANITELLNKTNNIYELGMEILEN